MKSIISSLKIKNELCTLGLNYSLIVCIERNTYYLTVYFVHFVVMRYKNARDVPIVQYIQNVFM